ncbi:MAG: type II toxin-antitoxin system VapC family toxin [Planctomycetes bacterium]|nr:type II toxin-antitoxin system VapC family toxin [Planctomycetota bacterium]
MILDTSALLAILLAEPDAAAHADAIEHDPKRLLSSVSYLEASIVLFIRKGRPGLASLDSLIRRARLEVIPFDAAQVVRARDAYWAFGKGRHPAALNMGDCCVYALSAATGEPILCKGTDYVRTDAKRVPLEEGP